MAASLRTFIRNAIVHTHKASRELNGPYQSKSLPCQTWTRSLKLARPMCQEEKDTDIGDAEEADAASGNDSVKRKVVDVETSIQYLNSEAFAAGYGDKPVWFYYRRNHKGGLPPKTRRTCIRKGQITTASPCPICRDEYLVLHAKNTKLLEQFISPHSGELLDYMKTGLCQMQHKKLTLEVMRAYDEGRIEMKLPFRTYDYDDYKS